MSRINGLSERDAGLFVRAFYRETRRQTKKPEVVEPVSITAHHPRVLAGYGAFEYALARSHRVPERLKELASLKAALVARCEFCIDIGTMLGRVAGLTQEQLLAVPRHRESDLFAPVEKLVLDYAEAMTATPVDVSDELFAQLREQFDEAQIVELTAVIAFENYRARFNWALEIGAAGFAEGMVCPTPVAQEEAA
jgi:AhpD family alkylhydroperoxidase